MKPKKIEIVSMVKVTYEANDSSLIPKRIIEEYWTPDGRRIGRWDLLDQFPLIKSEEPRVNDSWRGGRDAKKKG